MPRYRSPYGQQRSRSRNTGSILIMGLLGLMVVVLGLFLLADRLGSSPLSTDSTSEATPGATETVSGTHATPGTAATPTTVDTAQLRSSQDVAEAWVRLWSNDNYEGMYQLLSATSKSLISEADFVARYEGIAQEVGQTSLTATLVDGPEDADQYTMHVARESGRVGPIEEDNVITLVEDGDGWRVNWTPSLIFAELNNGFVRWKPDNPQRGRILDRKGRPLAHLGTISQIGIVPGQIQDEAAMVTKLSELLGMSEDAIKARYAGGQPDWFMPVRSYPDQMDQALLDGLASLPGVVVQKWPERVYPAKELTAHVVGYMSEITAEELPEMTKLGYASGDRIGRSGIEQWAEQYLAGKRGGRLVLVSPEGNETRTVAEVKSEAAADVVLTLDLDVQTAAMQALGDRTGAVVVIDPSNGGILAMASNPTFDPNQFILGVTDEAWAAMNDPVRRPLENRATQIGYPIGSTFKVVTMAAGMQHLGMTAQSMVECPATFSVEGSDQVWRDWNPNGQGTLSLHNALVQSCNTVFYKFGADLDKQDEQLLPNMAKGFGFGSATGIEELFEIPGVVPDPQWKIETVGDYWARGDAINLAIGQGYFLATPLQLADTYAAIANGGTLWQPYLVQEAAQLDGTKVYTAEPKERGKLSIPPEILQEIQWALNDAVNAPNGSAYEAFSGIGNPVAGKTGTAENAQGSPHAWFAAYTPIDNPRITGVALVEHAVGGATDSAPIVRQVIEAYYNANP